jgi:hypothetical protein
MTRTLAAALAALVCGGCASGAWHTVDGTIVTNERLPQATAHRAVEHVTLHVYGREFEFVGYRTTGEGGHDVRAQLLLESGLSVLDAAVHDATNERISGSVFESIPNFARTAMDDLRRTWGSRSVFRIDHLRPNSGGNVDETTAQLSDGERTLPAHRVDAGWVAYRPRTAAADTSLDVTLLDADLVPEATITYSDFDEDGVPREIHLVDLVHEHTLDVEVEEVTLTSKAKSPAKDAPSK